MGKTEEQSKNYNGKAKCEGNGSRQEGDETKPDIEGKELGCSLKKKEEGARWGRAISRSRRQYVNSSGRDGGPEPVGHQAGVRCG